jgi:hypothetical protein
VGVYGVCARACQIAHWDKHIRFTEIHLLETVFLMRNYS